MSVIDALQVLAFRDVLLKSPEYRVRSIQRWFSTTFNTPLLTVQNDIPLTVILQHYFETQFENAEPEELEETRKLLLETDGQRHARLMAEDAEAAGNEEIHRLLEEEAQKLSTKKNPGAPIVPSVVHPPGIIPESRLPDTFSKEIPPDIEMKFVSPEELERSLESFGQVPVPKKS